MNCIFSLLECLVIPINPSKADGRATTIWKSEVERSKRARSSSYLSYSVFPHFHEETKAYIRGITEVLEKLPVVKAKALKRVKRSTSRVLLEGCKKQCNVGSSRNRTRKMLSQFKTHGREARGGILRVFRVTGRRVMGRRVPEATHAAAGVVGNQLRNEPSSLVNIGTVPPLELYLKYDGLRSSPPFSSTSAHSWKLYTGPFSDTQQPTTEVKSLDTLEYEMEQPTPRLALATEARRATPKLVALRHHQPSVLSDDATSPSRTLPTIRLPSSSLFPPLLPTPGFSLTCRHLNNHGPSMYSSDRPLPPQSPRASHYTSPHACRLFSKLKSHLLLPTTGPGSPTTADLVAGLLFRWPQVRRHVREFDPALAEEINMLDWAGVETEFGGGGHRQEEEAEEEAEKEKEKNGGGWSYVRRQVADWVSSGEALFGDWEGPWLGGGGGVELARNY